MPIAHVFPFSWGFFHRTSLCIHDTRRSAICINKLIRYTLFYVHVTTVPWRYSFSLLEYFHHSDVRTEFFFTKTASNTIEVDIFR